MWGAFLSTTIEKLFVHPPVSILLRKRVTKRKVSPS
tara:strand:+ start:769 stop:876 length:108 start_codon:yes stop_codon:yes gene_type:complete